MANMTEININLFARLKSNLFQTGGINVNEKRWIKTNDIEKEWLQKAKIIFAERINSNDVLFGIEFGNSFFIAFPLKIETETPFLHGLVSNESDAVKLRENAGLLTLMWSQEFFPFAPSDNIGAVITQLAFANKGEMDASSIAPIFSKYDFWEIDTDVLGKSVETLYSVYSAYLIEINKSANYILLSYSPDTLNKFKVLFESFHSRVTGKILFDALCSNSWQHCFLDVYRCIEYLYQMPYLISLCKELNDAGLLPVLYEKVERNLSWRPKDEQALIKLLVEFDGHKIIEDLIKALSGSSDSAGKNQVEKVSKLVYGMRNSIAHWRYSTSKNKIDVDWDEVIGYLLDITNILYASYKSQVTSLIPEPEENLAFSNPSKIKSIEVKPNSYTTITRYITV